MKFSLFSKHCQKSSIGWVSPSDGNLERWESEEFFTKEIIEKAFKIAEIWFFENYAFFRCLPYFSKNHIFAILKAFLIISFVKNPSNFHLSRLPLFEEIRPILNFWQSFENKEKWAFWVQTSNCYISDKTHDFSIIFL